MILNNFCFFCLIYMGMYTTCKLVYGYKIEITEEEFKAFKKKEDIESDDLYEYLEDFCSGTELSDDMFGGYDDESVHFITIKEIGYGGQDVSCCDKVEIPTDLTTDTITVCGKKFKPALYLGTSFG